MADFISGFWDLYVAGIAAFGLVLCLILLLANRTVEETGAPKLKGHVWDENLKEYNNPLPLWWLVLFLGTVIFSIVYLVVYPGFGNRKSTPGNDTGLRAEYFEEMQKAQKDYNLGKYKGESLVALATNKEAMATGQRLFLTYCAQCHGSLGKGAKGYPDLTDNDWIFGGDPDTIKASIADGRAGLMPAFGAKLNGEEILDVANYARSLSGQKDVDAARAKRGEVIFKGEGGYQEKMGLVCATCHGATGAGVPGLGPNLADNIWLFDSSEKTVVEGITKGRNDPEAPGSLKSVMPAWKNFLSDADAKIHILAAYVHSLSKK